MQGFWERWTTDPLFARPKESTNIHNRELHLREARRPLIGDRYGVELGIPSQDADNLAQ